MYSVFASVLWLVIVLSIYKNLELLSMIAKRLRTPPLPVKFCWAGTPFCIDLKRLIDAFCSLRILQCKRYYSKERKIVWNTEIRATHWSFSQRMVGNCQRASRSWYTLPINKKFPFRFLNAPINGSVKPDHFPHSKLLMSSWIENLHNDTVWLYNELQM